MSNILFIKAIITILTVVVLSAIALDCAATENYLSSAGWVFFIAVHVGVLAREILDFSEDKTN